MKPLPATLQVFQRGWLSSNNILLSGRGDTALIDSGYASHAPQTLALVQAALQGRPLDRLFNTHLHSDHCGGNAILQAHYGCRTAIPAAEADKVRCWDTDALSFKATGQQCQRFVCDATIAPGDVLILGELEWQVLGAPGHDPHALIFYCPQERLLISGDALWENGFGVIFPELDGESGFAEARATLELIAGLDAELAIPGHGAPFGAVDGALKRAFSRLDYLSSEPLRNAQNAVKVLLKFLLLERRRIALAELPDLLDAIPVLRASNRRLLRQPRAELAAWAVRQLIKAGAARIDGAYLINEPA
ncbi:MBL fold metallo-hydrolase [Janthinobacterium agaricidamnosum]|uniref:Metallo-beta-lactamase superfamily protein n=1 Tax=Janthinobacterium agaricidamnosum NBRC 102515 = DSM 9628 TaxID=1349767 RepID=W0VDS4_9BURK|nr:MBL fold metallo-hydrolase [Janthinobacterium agaricidamnosum]CDG85825.1 metallo-beta-lactamase superfamily protein [Janthinobacterium agaricidamnosum NBRC 102515 = DSM 9628]